MSLSARGFVVATLLALLALRRRAGPGQSQLPVAGATARSGRPTRQRLPCRTAADATNPYLVPNLAGASGLASLSNPYLGNSARPAWPMAAVIHPTPALQPVLQSLFSLCSPYGGRLMGLAALTTANAQFYVTIQQGRIVNQQANQAMIDTRRKIFDQIRYERMSIPSGEEIRVRDLEVALNRSTLRPPVGRDPVGHIAQQSAQLPDQTAGRSAEGTARRSRRGHAQAHQRQHHGRERQRRPAQGPQRGRHVAIGR